MAFSEILTLVGIGLIGGLTLIGLSQVFGIVKNIWKGLNARWFPVTAKGDELNRIVENISNRVVENERMAAPTEEQMQEVEELRDSARELSRDSGIAGDVIEALLSIFVRLNNPHITPDNVIANDRDYLRNHLDAALQLTHMLEGTPRQATPVVMAVIGGLHQSIQQENDELSQGTDPGAPEGSRTQFFEAETGGAFRALNSDGSRGEQLNPEEVQERVTRHRMATLLTSIANAQGRLTLSQADAGFIRGNRRMALNMAHQMHNNRAHDVVEVLLGIQNSLVIPEEENDGVTFTSPDNSSTRIEFGSGEGGGEEEGRGVHYVNPPPDLGSEENRALFRQIVQMHESGLDLEEIQRALGAGTQPWTPPPQSDIGQALGASRSVRLPEHLASQQIPSRQAILDYVNRHAGTVAESDGVTPEQRQQAWRQAIEMMQNQGIPEGTEKVADSIFGPMVKKKVKKEDIPKPGLNRFQRIRRSQKGKIEKE